MQYSKKYLQKSGQSQTKEEKGLFDFCRSRKKFCLEQIIAFFFIFFTGKIIHVVSKSTFKVLLFVFHM